MELHQPKRLGHHESALIEDLLELVAQGQQTAVDAIVQMLEDLVTHGLESRYAKKMQRLPIWELKTRSRGGEKGGARVYFFVHQGLAYVVNAETKQGDQPSQGKLLEVYGFWKSITGGKDGQQEKD